MTQGLTYLVIFFIFICICIGIGAASKDKDKDKKRTSIPYAPPYSPPYRPTYLPPNRPPFDSYDARPFSRVKPQTNMNLNLPTTNYDKFCLSCGRLIRAGKRCENCE